jgi:hypothetical protein
MFVFFFVEGMMNLLTEKETVVLKSLQTAKQDLRAVERVSQVYKRYLLPVAPMQELVSALREQIDKDRHLLFLFWTERLKAKDLHWAEVLLLIKRYL